MDCGGPRAEKATTRRAFVTRLFDSTKSIGAALKDGARSNPVGRVIPAQQIPPHAGTQQTEPSWLKASSRCCEAALVAAQFSSRLETPIDAQGQTVKTWTIKAKTAATPTKPRRAARKDCLDVVMSGLRMKGASRAGRSGTKPIRNQA
jgi:hypothetical protein